MYVVAGAIEATETRGGSVFADLAAAGFTVDRIGELRRRDSRAAVPILLRWLPRADDRHLKRAIVGALGVSWARPVAAPALIAEFRQAPPHDPDGYKWAVGYALSAVVDDTVFDDLVPLVCDGRHGHARQMIVGALGTLRHPRAVDVLVSLLADDDTDIVEQALGALGQLKAGKARPYIAPLLTHHDCYVRREAARALARIDRTRRRGAE